jgi:hypothetical protein
VGRETASKGFGSLHHNPKVTTNRRSNENSRKPIFYTMAALAPVNLKIPFAAEGERFNHENFNAAMQQQFGCTLSYCSVSIGSSLNKLAHGGIVADADSYSSESIRVEDIETYRENLIDLSFLKKLRIEDDEPFIPTKIFFRSDMRKIFGMYLNDVGAVDPKKRVKPMKRPTVLIGSPGVGKSVLFFLAAMYRCSLEPKEEVVVKVEEEIETYEQVVVMEVVSGKEEIQTNEKVAAKEEMKTNKEVAVKEEVMAVNAVNTSIYYRWARSDPFVSVFIMFRDEDQKEGDRKVHVLFTRSLNENRISLPVGSLGTLNHFLETQLGIDRKHYFAFVDGPKHTETNNTLNGKYDYFCTSGGMLAFKSEQGGKDRLWILNAWTKYESVQALLALHVRLDSPSAEGAVQTTASVCPNDQDLKTGDMMHLEGEVENQNSHQSSAITANVITAEMSYEFEAVEEKANQAYWLCGGRIREVRRAYNDYEQIKVEICAPLRQLRKEDIILAGSETEMAGGKNLDRLRTIFRDEKNGDDNIMYSFFVVESPFKLMYAAIRVRVAQWVEAYILVKDGPKFMRGGFFEMAIHKWIETSGTDKTKSVEKNVPVGTVVDGVDTSTEETVATKESSYICSMCKTALTVTERENVTKKTSPIYSVCLSEGTKVEGVQMLSKSNVYWVPSKENFENIDSAVIINKKLHVFQMTVAEQHGFSLTTFIEKFALPVWKNLDLEDKFDSVFIYIVTPSDITFQCKAFTEDLADQFNQMKKGTRDSNKDEFFFDIELEPLTRKVDMTSVDTHGNSLKELLKTLPVERTGTDKARITERFERWLHIQKELKAKIRADKKANEEKKKSVKKQKK